MKSEGKQERYMIHIPSINDKSELMILTSYHKNGACRLFNLVNGRLMVSRYIVVDKNSSWNQDSNNSTKRPLLSSILDEVSDKLNKTQPIEVSEHDRDEVENHDDKETLIQRPQRTRKTPTRLQDYEVIGDNEVTSDGDLVQFSLIAYANPINHNKALRTNE